ncbi:MAG TPA: biotin carboxylase N-terminal domain-containing protein [Syntrophales bacterium]|nr:biotin carboxylase N-terminal domain-containing protein [Syntrophales bacterium]
MKKIRKVLVANRGEIALRIIRTLKERNIEAIAVYETPDQDAYYLRFADRAVMIGREAGKNYLDADRIIRAARKSGADAVHPGYGFLAENAEFAEACEKAGLVFIGPPPEVIRTLGHKVLCKEVARRAGVDPLPGTDSLPAGEAAALDALRQFARAEGYPLMLKATAGGGGRGIRKVEREADLAGQLHVARAEARSAFNDDRLYVERYIESPRHVEVQILADRHGKVLHLGTRDCSIQRRHQKLLEVAPAHLPAPVIEAIQTAAIEVMKTAGYVNAGTVEFLVDPKTLAFWFMEVNTRLQVEHTVTEMLTGVDIVAEQLRIAAGEALTLDQEQIRLPGAAIEVRINAEDPKNYFLPEAGRRVEVYQPPGGPGIRLDGTVYQGYVIPAVYDSLLVKLTVWGVDWDQAVRRLRRALRDFRLAGPKTTIPFYLKICDEPDFQAGRFQTDYLETHSDLFAYDDDPVWRGGETGRAEHLVLDEAEAPAEPLPPGFVEPPRVKPYLLTKTVEDAAGDGAICSPIKGRVMNIRVRPGETVYAGDVLMILETMKMCTNVITEVTGQVAELYVGVDDTIDVDEPLIRIAAS